MNTYVTGAMIRRLREGRKMTQSDLAEKLSVSDKAVSKWETGKGYPDITLLEPLADVLGVSVLELISGSDVCNRNRSCNMKRMQFYVCPVCGNVLTGTGEAVISCCGITLPPLEAEAPNEAHQVQVACVEDEYYVTLPHEMQKGHYISFLAAVRDDSLEMVKLYPEGGAEARFQRRNVDAVYFYCNRHGLFRQSLGRRKKTRESLPLTR